VAVEGLEDDLELGWHFHGGPLSPAAHAAAPAPRVAEAAMVSSSAAHRHGRARRDGRGAAAVTGPGVPGQPPLVVHPRSPVVMRLRWGFRDAGFGGGDPGPHG